MSHLASLNYAYGKPSASAIIRSVPDDFRVDEQLSFKPEGAGQHAYLRIEKTNLTTSQVANSLAKFADVKSVAIGYAGLKDKHAVTSQWFSVDLAGKPEPQWHQLETEELKALEVARHGRKLKRGAIAQNTFELILRELSGDGSELEQRLEKVKQSGVPNYFGEQRFGNNDFNLKKAEQLLLGGKKVKRHLRSIYLSAARSYLFNQVLSQRVLQSNWNKAIEGDVFMLQGSHSVFAPEHIDDEIRQRISASDIHPTGPMWGQGEVMHKHAVHEMEEQLRQDYPQWCSLLESYGLKQERRALRLLVHGLDWVWQDNKTLLLKFSLSSGSYATTVLRELVA